MPSTTMEKTWTMALLDHMKETQCIEDFYQFSEIENYLEVAYEQFRQNQATTIKLHTKEYFAYHYFAYINFFYSYKERFSHFVNKYLALGYPSRDVSYFSISKNTRAREKFSRAFSVFTQEAFKGIALDRKTLVHHPLELSQVLQRNQLVKKSISTENIDRNVLDKPHEALKSISIAVIECLEADTKDRMHKGENLTREVLQGSVLENKVASTGNNGTETAGIKHEEVKK